TRQFVMAGLVPAISLMIARLCHGQRDRRVKPGDDREVGADPLNTLHERSCTTTRIAPVPSCQSAMEAIQRIRFTNAHAPWYAIGKAEPPWDRSHPCPS